MVAQMCVFMVIVIVCGGRDPCLCLYLWSVVAQVHGGPGLWSVVAQVHGGPDLWSVVAQVHGGPGLCFHVLVVVCGGPDPCLCLYLWSVVAQVHGGPDLWSMVAVICVFMSVVVVHGGPGPWWPRSVSSCP